MRPIGKSSLREDNYLYFNVYAFSSNLIHTFKLFLEDLLGSSQYFISF